MQPAGQGQALDSVEMASTATVDRQNSKVNYSKANARLRGRLFNPMDNSSRSLRGKAGIQGTQWTSARWFDFLRELPANLDALPSTPPPMDQEHLLALEHAHEEEVERQARQKKEKKKVQMEEVEEDWDEEDEDGEADRDEEDEDGEEHQDGEEDEDGEEEGLSNVMEVQYYPEDELVFHYDNVATTEAVDGVAVDPEQVAIMNSFTASHAADGDKKVAAVPHFKPDSSLRLVGLAASSLDFTIGGDVDYVDMEYETPRASTYQAPSSAASLHRSSPLMSTPHQTLSIAGRPPSAPKLAAPQKRPALDLHQPVPKKRTSKTALQDVVNVKGQQTMGRFFTGAPS